MAEYLLLALAAAAAFVLGRPRRGSLAAILTGLASAAGYFILRFALPGLVPSSKASQSDIVRYVLPWAWVAASLLFARFGLGRSAAKPGREWVCPACGSSNPEEAASCGACGLKYSAPCLADEDRTEP